MSKSMMTLCRRSVWECSMVNIYGGTFIKRQGYENDGLALCTKKQILKSNIAAQGDVGNVTYRLHSR